MNLAQRIAALVDDVPQTQVEGVRCDIERRADRKDLYKSGGDFAGSVTYGETTQLVVSGVDESTGDTLTVEVRVHRQFHRPRH